MTELKKKIRPAQFKATLAVNRELICLYWDIGKKIIERKEKDGWVKYKKNNGAKK